MTFAGIPWWATGALLAGSAGVLAVLHLLRVRPRELRVITTMFWARAVEKPRARTLLHRFRHPWTFAVLLLVCVLLSLALSQPEWPGKPANRISEVIILSCGASMAAPAGGEAGSEGTRLGAACEIALQRARSLTTDDRLAVIAADPWPRLVHSFDDPRPVVRQRLAELSPAEAPAAEEASWALARSLLEGRANPSILLITDRASGAVPSGFEEHAIETRMARVGDPADNAAILSVGFEADDEEPFRGRLHVRVGYWGRGAGEHELRIERAGGAPLLAERRTMSPGTASSFVVPDLPTDGDSLTVSLRPDDAVSADNRVSFVLPLRRVVRVGVGGAAPEALWSALESDRGVQLAEEGEDRDVELVIVDTGPRALVGAAVRVAPSSSLAASLDFEGAVCGGGAALGPPDGEMESLLLANDQVLAAVSPAGETPRLLLGSALVAEDASVIHRPAFAVLLARVMRRLAGWDDDPAVLPADRALRDPLWAQRAGHTREVVVLFGSREAGDLSLARAGAAEELELASRRWAVPAPFELLLVGALALLVLEAVLHSRGRIP